MPKNNDTRMSRAEAILKLPYPVLRDENDNTFTHFYVRASDFTLSQFRDHYYYSVRWLGNDNKFQKWDCECVDFDKNIKYNSDFMCKHCLAVAMAVTQKRRLRNVDPRTLLPTTV